MFCFVFVSFLLSSFSESGQAVVSRIVPSPSGPVRVPSVFVAHRVQHSHCSSIFIECYVANSRSRAVCGAICAQEKVTTNLYEYALVVTPTHAIYQVCDATIYYCTLIGEVCVQRAWSGDSPSGRWRGRSICGVLVAHRLPCLVRWCGVFCRRDGRERWMEGSSCLHSSSSLIFTRYTIPAAVVYQVLIGH